MLSSAPPTVCADERPLLLAATDRVNLAHERARPALRIRGIGCPARFDRPARSDRRRRPMSGLSDRSADLDAFPDVLGHIVFPALKDDRRAAGKDSVGAEAGIRDDENWLARWRRRLWFELDASRHDDESRILRLSGRGCGQTETRCNDNDTCRPHLYLRGARQNQSVQSVRHPERQRVGYRIPPHAREPAEELTRPVGPRCSRKGARG